MKKFGIIFNTFFYLSWLILISLKPVFAENPSISSSLTIIPPSPVTDKITLSIRGAIKNIENFPIIIDAKFYLDERTESSLLYEG